MTTTAGTPSQSTLDHLNRRYGALTSVLTDWAETAYERYQCAWTNTTPGDVRSHNGREYTVVRIDSNEAVIRWNDTGEDTILTRYIARQGS